jgi:hypothetical protein
MTTTLGIANNNSTIGPAAPRGQEMGLGSMISGGSIFHQAKGEKPSDMLSPKVLFGERCSRQG